MIIAAPGPSSRLFEPVADMFGHLLAAPQGSHPRSLWQRSGTDVLVRCRGFDIPELVASGAVDLGITGYDVCVEFCLATGEPLIMRALPAARTSFVTYCTVAGRDVETIYTEYPAITEAWLSARADQRPVRIVRLHGSTEGVIRADDHGAGVLLVTSGETLAANGLDIDVPLLATDMCVVTRSQSVRWPGTGDLTALTLPSFTSGR
ncbi:type 2 periplasmic-binding domain-containing protein [Micromonospora sp. AKA38]|uniref:hypothetical protein n=1 Tax=Micromonospora sp. AKA38 TaxID=2733861 RepID=UPI0022C85293|nr:hypothetical protein [Micromonospora sp. AKA38]GHJ17069.1 hypothetical protein TPA0908_50640 [Micromonospora sp. AKA38]